MAFSAPHVCHTRRMRARPAASPISRALIPPKSTWNRATTPEAFLTLFVEPGLGGRSSSPPTHPKNRYERPLAPTSAAVCAVVLTLTVVLLALPDRTLCELTGGNWGSPPGTWRTSDSPVCFR